MGKLLIITSNWPAPTYSAVGVRLMQLADFFIGENFQITIASTADKSTANVDYFKEISLASIRLNHSSFDDFVKKLNPDVVLFDRFMTEEQFGWRVAANIPGAIRILDTEDLHSLRKSREEALKRNTPWSQEYWLQYDMTKREVASILRSDISLIISNFETQLLKTILPNHESLLLHLPFMIEPLSDQTIDKWPSFEERKDFVFIGFGGHSPNVDAIEYLKKDIWPLIHKELPEVTINVYGGNLPEKIYQLHNKDEGFLIRGWAEDALEVISTARVMLAPLRFGAGQKGKLVDAMRCGTPSITTSIGAEGMYRGSDWCGQITDDPKAFAKAAIEVYQNHRSWADSRDRGIEIIKEVFDKNELHAKFRNKISTTRRNLKKHRNTNFMGALIQHQSLSATKYMGKWIEEKNSLDENI